jgi:hypothetical protein
MFSLELLDRGTDSRISWIGPTGYVKTMCRMTIEELTIVMASFMNVMISGEELRIMKLV